MDVSYEGAVINRPVPPVYEEELVAEPHLSSARKHQPQRSCIYPSLNNCVRHAHDSMS